MLRLLATRRWLSVTAGAIVFVLVCLQLGSWQWSRHLERKVRADAVVTNYAAPPSPLASVLPAPGVALTQEQGWTRVTVTGQYTRQQLLVRGRALEGRPGFEVLAPLRLGSAVLVVDRGWVPVADAADELPQTPPPPTGEVEVTGWLRPGEESWGRDLPAGQLASVNLAEAQQQIAGPLYGAYLVLESERTADGATPARPTPLARPASDLGPHQAYAIQWWLTALLAPVFLVLMLRREHTARQSAGDPASPRVVPASAGGPTSRRPAARSENPTRPRRDAAARKRKVRIWDEEDY